MDENPQRGERAAAPRVRASQLVVLLGRNARVLAGAGLVARLATLAATIGLARGLGQDEFGRYVVAIAFASLLGILVELGTGGYLVREVARDSGRLGRTTGIVLVLRTASGAAAIAVAALLPPLLGYDAETWAAIALFTAAAAARSLGATFLSALQGLERLHDVAVVQALQSLATAAATLAVIALGGGLIAVSVAVLAVAAASVPWSSRALKAASSDPIDLRLAGVRAALPVVAGFSGVVVFSTAITYVDSLLVNAFEGDEATGLYGAAYRILLALYFIPTVYGTALARSMSRLATTDRDAVAWLYSRIVCHLTVAALPLALYGVVGSRALLETLYGEPYADADTTLALLLASLLFTFPAWIASTTAYATGAERRIVAIVAASFALNVAANLVAIPAFGIEGAAAVNAATEAFTLVLLVVVLRRIGLRLDALAAIGKPLLAIAPPTVVVLALPAVPLAVRLAAGAVLYGAGLLLLRAFDAHDARFVRALGRGGERQVGAGPPSRLASRRARRLRR